MEALLAAVISGSITAIMVLLIKLVFRNKISPKIHFSLWLILAVRLLLPVFPASPFSFQNFMPFMQTQNALSYVQPAEVEPYIPQNSADVNTVDKQESQSVPKIPQGTQNKETAVKPPEVQQNTTKSAENVSNTAIIKPENVIFTVWAVGCGAALIYFVAVYLIFRRKVKTADPCVQAEIIKIFDDCKKNVHVKREIPLKNLENVRPMLVGLIRPQILFSKETEKDRLEYIFTHELCHYKHGDIFYTFLSVFFVCLYWYNPIIWFCQREFRRDLEILCDRNVVEKIGNKKDYAAVLLSEALTQKRFYPLTTSMCHGKSEIAKRLRFMAEFKKMNAVTVFVLVISLSVVCAGCLTDCEPPLPNDNVAVTEPQTQPNKSDESNGTTDVEQTTLPEKIPEPPLKGELCRWLMVPQIEADDIQPIRTDGEIGRFTFRSDFNYTLLSIITRNGKEAGINFEGEIKIPFTEYGIHTDELGLTAGVKSEGYNAKGDQTAEIPGHGFARYFYDITRKSICRVEETGAMVYIENLNEICDKIEGIAALQLIKTNPSNPADIYSQEPLENQYIYVSVHGKPLTDTVYADVSCFSEGFAAAKLNDKWGYIDSTGKTVIPFEYDYAYSFSGGFAAVCKDGKWGYIDAAGSTYIPFQFEQARPVSVNETESKAWVKMNGKWGVINITAVYN